MKIILLIVASVTTLCVWAGYRVGSVLSERPVLGTFLANTQVTQLGKDQFLLNFECNGKTLATFDVDKDKVISQRMTDERIEEIVLNSQNRKLYQRVYDQVISIASAGGALKLAKPAFDFVKEKKNSKYTVPTVIGAVSGFYLGYGLAVWGKIDCDDYIVLQLTQDAEVWKSIKAMVAEYYLLDEMKPSRLLDQKTSDELNEIRQAIENGKVDSSTFAKLQSIDAYVKPQESDRGWFTRTLIVGVWLPVAVMLMGAIIIGFWLSRSAAQHVKRRRQRGVSPTQE
jgi:hypothetical protein